MKYKKQPRNIDLDTYQELASVGFIAAVNLLAHTRGIDSDDALSYLAHQVGRDFLQMQSYKKTGLPDHLIEVVIGVLAKNEISFGCHQLRPNSSMVQTASLNKSKK